MVSREKLEEFNEWWFTGKVPEELALGKKRKVFNAIKKFAGKRQIVSITGLRRTGKTTILYQLIGSLLKEGTEAKNIFYFSFDEKAESLEDIINSYRETSGADFRNEKVYIFLDEVQKFGQWPDQIKKYYDLYPKIKFFISGSEGLFLSSKSKERLAGRIYEFVLKTLSFKEYINFSGFDADKIPESKIKQLFSEFIIKGGFPEMIGKELPEVRLYVKSVVIDKIIFQDMVKMAGIKNTDLLKTLIEIFAANPGMYIEYQSLAKQLDSDRRLIKSYIGLLEQSFLVKLMSNYRKGKSSSLRKTKRLYLVDTGIITAYKASIGDDLFGKMVETAVINGINSSFFWKNSHEVDIVAEYPIEIKYKAKVINKDLAGMKECMRKFSFKTGIVLTKSHEETVSAAEGRILLKPVWKFLIDK